MLSNIPYKVAALPVWPKVLVVLIALVVVLLSLLSIPLVMTLVFFLFIVAGSEGERHA